MGGRATASRLTFDRATVILTTLSVVYMVSQFYRGSVAVIAPELVVQFAITASGLGLLGGLFFLASSCVQLPIGVLFDRYGPRRTVPLLLMFVVAGSLLFALAGRFLDLAAARVLMGVGSAGIATGALVVCARWYPSSRYGTVTGILVAVGTTGALISTTPLALAAETLGWRGAFVGMAAVTLALAALFWLVVRDAPPGHPSAERPRESLGEMVRGLGRVMVHPTMPYVFAMNFVGYPSGMAILGLWGGPYLHEVHGLDPVARGNVLLLMTVGVILGNLLFGPLDSWLDTRKWVTVGGALLSIACLVLLALVGDLPVGAVAVLFFLIGFATGYSITVMAHGRAVFPDRAVGRGITALNLAMHSGAAVLPWGGGILLDALTPAEGLPGPGTYRWMFAAIALVQFAAMAFYLRCPDARPSRDG